MWVSRTPASGVSVAALGLRRSVCRCETRRGRCLRVLLGLFRDRGDGWHVDWLFVLLLAHRAGDVLVPVVASRRRRTRPPRLSIGLARRRLPAQRWRIVASTRAGRGPVDPFGGSSGGLWAASDLGGSRLGLLGCGGLTVMSVVACS